MPHNKKLETFLDAINQDANERRQKIMAEAERFNADELSKAEQSVLDDVVRLIDREDAEIRSNLKAEMSRREMESRRSILRKRDAYCNAVFEAAFKKILAYTRGEAYKKNLLESLRTAAREFGFKGGTVYLKKDESVAEDEIRTVIGPDCRVVRSNDISLGGFILEDTGSSVMIDNTLDAKLNAQKKWFIENCNLAV